MLRSHQIAILGGHQHAFRAQVLNYPQDQTPHDNTVLYFIPFNKLHVMVRYCSTNKVLSVSIVLAVSVWG